MPSAPAPSSPPAAPLLPAECALLATLLRRAIANSQLAFHEQDLGADGRETEAGPSVVAQDWAVDADLVRYDDGTAPRHGVHLYAVPEDLDLLFS